MCLPLFVCVQYRYNTPVSIPSPSNVTTPEQTYNERCASIATERDYYDRRSHRMANISLLLVGATLVCVAVAVAQTSWALAAIALVLGIGFAASYSYHYRVDLRYQHFRELWAINQEGLQRLARDWAALPLHQAPAVPNALAADLDVVGHASLLHLLGTAATPVGQCTLQHWLLDGTDPATIAQRQAAVVELAPLVELRDELALRGRVLGAVLHDPQPFLRWAESESWLDRRPWLVWIARITPLALIGAVLLQLGGVIAFPLWLVVVAINGLVSWTAGRGVNVILDQISARQRVFGAYAALFELAAQQQFTSPLLRQMQNQSTADNDDAAMQMRRLSRRVALADLRASFFFIVLQLATLWSVHALWLLERWQRNNGSAARRWLQALGDWEAVAALATLHHDHPHWTFPTSTAAQPIQLRAHELGHPLLPPAACVGNDVVIGPPGTFLLVTGSNMSGKSTLLRAVGLNVLLAQAGGPVCAQMMILPPLTLATSMRVQDSLEAGVSYFMAEIQRLKIVVDQAQAAQLDNERTVLFLLDEILHGTNTGERQIAARQIIRHLLQLGAIGAVSTHDLTLADEPKLAAASQAVHFTETFTRGADGPTMWFDYRLRPGVATSTNALKLMELIGLPVEPQDADTAAIEPAAKQHV